MVRMVLRGDSGPVEMMAPVIFGLVTMILTLLIVRTLWLLVSGRMLG
jgi:tellurite resistance protein